MSVLAFGLGFGLGLGLPVAVGSGFLMYWFYKREYLVKRSFTKFENSTTAPPSTPEVVAAPDAAPDATPDDAPDAPDASDVAPAEELPPCDISCVNCECHERKVWMSDVIQGAISYPVEYLEKSVTEDLHAKAS